MKEKVYDAGDMILKEGDPSDVVYLILAGEIEVFTEHDGKTVVLGTMKEGEFLGELGIVDGQPRSASARTKTQVSLKIFDKKEFFELISQDSASAYRLISRLCEQMRRLTRRLAEATAAIKTNETLEDEVPLRIALEIPPEPETKFECSNFRFTILPSSQRLVRIMPKEGITILNLPFLIGRSPKRRETAPSMHIDLILPDKRPFRLSRQHFGLYQDREGCGILDLGSTTGTQVNGEFLGRVFGKDFEYLNPGENQVVAGGLDSPFIFTVLMEPV